MEINDELVKEISESLNIKDWQVKIVLELLNEGNTVPFIARYRKEKTKALNEEQIREISKSFEYGLALEKRKEDVIRLIDEKGLLTEELKSKIISSTKLVEVEDLYRPYKEKKKTKATEAIKCGLEPLAKKIMAFPLNGSLEILASAYINSEIETVEKALEGASYIIAEWISDNASYRSWIRNESMKNASIHSKQKKNAKDESLVYQMYYEYSEPIKTLKPHRILAMNRAEKENVCNISIDFDVEKISGFINSKVIKNKDSFVCEFVKEAIKDSLKRLILPSVEREIRSEISEKAEDNAISIFSVNLKNLLLQQPLKGKIVMGVDPAYRTGCKLAILDQMGKVLDIGVIYPTIDVLMKKDAKKIFLDFVNKYHVEVVAIGNGTASRETEDFVADAIKDVKHDICYAIVSEAGASVYSASKTAIEEFPSYTVEKRSAISIGRRLQDPLSELVKIDPKAIGVGQYQHDVAESKLEDSLNFVVSEAVNKVGVNINTASKSLLGYVSGINKTIAANIVNYREENGEFKSRSEIKNVPKLGDKTFEQAVGFLRIIDGNNPLDATSIHPESYNYAKEIAKMYNIDLNKLGSNNVKEIVEKIDKLILMDKLGIDSYTLDDILDAFIAPRRDPRDKLDKPLLRSKAMHIEDLQEGMELQGVVRNVVDFGAFVDCGLHQDGLVHISKISKGYISHPNDVLSVGDVVKVWVLSVDAKRGKIALTMIHE